MRTSTQFRLTTALLAALAVAGCSRPAPAPVANAPTPAAAPAPATPAPPTDADIVRFRIGTLDAIALKDGDIDAANDGKTFGVGRPVDAVSTLLTANGLPTDALHLSVQPLLVRADGRVLLFDTGAGAAPWARAGKLPASLRAAGITPAQVTDIFISHRHDDHVGGLVGSDGALAFPNAAIHLSAPEWKAMQADDKARALVAAITPKVATFAPGSAVIPGTVTAITDNGHTPGHSAYDITDGTGHLLYIGDSAHHSVVSVQRPEWSIAFDEDDALGKQRRREILKRAADGSLRVYAVHFPFPGIGKVEAKGEGFVWVAEQ